MEMRNLSKYATRVTISISMVILTGLMPSLLRAQQDLNELERCTLTMDKVNRLAEVFSDLGEVAKAHPELKQSFASDDDSHGSVSDLDRRLSAVPQLKAAIVRHGFSTHEFVVVEFTFMQSAMASALSKPGPDRAKRAAEAHVNPANLDFIDQHHTELEAIQKKMAAASSSSD